MIKTEIKIKNGKYVIHGSLCVPQKNTNAIAIFIHGLLDNGDSPFIKETSRIFTLQGIATFRFDLYSTKKNARTFEKTSITDYVDDLTNIISTYRQQYKKLYVVAHSLGAYSTLLVNRVHIDTIILWNPSIHPRDIFSLAQYDKNKQSYYDQQIKRAISKKMFDELATLPSIKSVLKRKHCPIGIITAEHGGVQIAKTYKENVTNLFGFIIIKKANHNFSTQLQRNTLAKETHLLLKKSPHF